MAKGVLNNIDLGEQTPNLSYEGIQKFNPIQRQVPKMGTLKKVLSASKESESVSPYKKSPPKPVEIKTAKPSMLPVEQVSPITTNVLEPVTRMNEPAAPVIKTATPSFKPIAAKPVVTEDVLSPIKTISQEDNAKVRTAVKNLADRAYSGEKTPLYPRDVYENDIRKGILEGEFSTYEDEQGNLSVKRNAPGLMVGVWEGQKLISENIKQAAKYYVANQDEKIKILEEERMISAMQPMQETSTGSEVGQIGGNIVGQVLLAQAPRLIPGVGPLIGAGISSTYMGAMQAYNSEKEAYNLARDNNLSEYDAYDVAEKGRGTYYTTGVAENFVSALVGARVGSAFKATASGASKGFGEAVKRFAATTGTKSLEVGLDSSVAAIASAIRDAKTEETTGEDLDILDRALENAKMEAYAGGAMAVLGSAYGAGSKAVPKWLKSQALNMASTMEEPTLVNTIDNMKRDGQLDQAQAEQLLLDVKNWNTTTESNIDVPAEKAGVINGLTIKKQGLLDKLKTADESSVPAIQAEVASIDAQISEARNNPDLLAGEVDDLTGQPLTPKVEVESPEVADIEKRRRSELSLQPLQINQTDIEYQKEVENWRNKQKEINDRYDAELKSLQNKIQKDATTTTQEQQQEGGTESNISQRQRTEGQQDQATNEADNRNRVISGETQQEVIPKLFNTEEGRRVFTEMEGIVDKTNLRQGNKDIAKKNAESNIENYLKGTKFYENATDVQREKMLRDAKKYFFDTRFKSAPSVTKLLGELEPKKITVNELSYFQSLLKATEQGQEAEAKFIRNTRIAITDGLRRLEALGKIGNKQFVSIMSKYDRVKLKNPESINRFVTYVSKVISDATFADKLSEAQRLRGLIKRAASIKTTQANLSSVAKQFASINPLNVQDIGEYSKLASTILEGVKSSRSTADLIVKFNQAFSVPEIKSYTDKQKAFIESEAKAKKLADYQYLVDSGVLSGEMSLDEMDTLINDIESEVETAPLKDKERYVKAYIKERFDSLIAFAKDLLDKGQDEFGVISDKKISDTDKKAVSQVLGIDITRLPLSDAYRVIESLDNFITNGETYGLDDILGRYEGNIKGDKLGKTFKKARPLSLFGSKDIGTFVAKQIETLPMVIYKMFRTDVATAKFLRESGIQSLFNNKNTAKLKANTMLNDFIKQFEGKKANGTDYNDAQNTVEQGILAFLRRNKGGSPREVQALFETRKALIQQGIDNLFSSGVDEDVKKAELYQQVFDKVAKDSKNISDVEANVDDVNKQVVDYWTERWAENYEDLRGVSKSIYRQELDQDKGYNPDSYRNISKEDTQVDIDNYDPFNNSGFSFNYEGNIPKKMNGTLIKQKGIETMPDGKYLDLNFVSNSYKSMQSALTDIYTAKDVRTVKSMLDSDGIKKVINSKDLAVLKEKVALYVKRSRNMDAIDYDELSKLSKRLADINRFITSASLGSLKQPIGQTFPLAIKTLIGAGRFDLGDAASITASMYSGVDSPVNRFLNQSGYGISVRGIESVANLQELSTLLKKTGGSIEKIGDLLNKRNDKVLKLLLSNPDAIIARASWLSYYKSALKAKGVDINNIDWDTHEIDTDAADIAQVNVDTQQNVSDADMQGKFMGSRKSATALIRNIVMPFSGFIMNSKAKMQADANTLISKVATSQDKIKAFRSMTGQFAEIGLYSLISSMATQGIKAAVSEIFGGEESEREREKRAITMKKSLYTNLVDDGLSPLPPMANNAINAGVNSILDYFNADEPEETKIRLYEGTNKSTLENMTESAGMLGIGARKAIDFGTSLSYATKGEVKSNFAGKESIKYLSPEEKEMAAIGAVMQFLYLSRLVPIAEFGSMANNINRLVEKRALTEKQQDIKDLVGELAAETDGTKVDGKSISDAVSRAANFKDPEQRARYILGLREKYGSDVIEKMYPLLEESKILNAGTAANMRAILDKKPEEIKFSRLFSYTKQDARVQKLLELRNSYPNKQDFYDNLKWAFQFNILNEEGLSLLYDKLETIKDFTDEEFDMLVASVEE